MDKAAKRPALRERIDSAVTCCVRILVLIKMLQVTVAAGPAGAATASVTCPESDPSQGSMFISEVLVDSAHRPLGAYTFVVLFDPSVVTIASIAGGETAEFSGPPIANPADFETGRARLLGFNSATLDSPTGLVSVARVTFEVVGVPGTGTSLALEVLTLADTDGASFEADINGCDVRVLGGMQPATPTITPTTTPVYISTATLTPSRTPSPDSTPTVSPPPIRCVGDCDGDSVVTVDEIVRGVSIALGELAFELCDRFDSFADKRITVDELVAAVSAALAGCPHVAEPTATPTVQPSVSETMSPTATITATPRENRAPTFPDFPEVNAFVGHSLSLALGAEDPDGDPVHYSAEDLPEEAALDPTTGVLSWTPSIDQAGLFLLPVACTDGGSPPLSATRDIPLRVSVPDACSSVVCTPGDGCEARMKPVAEPCCSASIQQRQPGHFLSPCPEGPSVHIGRNNSGFGRLQNCDPLRVINFLQAGASVRFHLEARCLNVAQPLRLWARLETKSRLVFDRTQMITLDPVRNGYAQKLTVVFPVIEPGPFFDLEAAEGLLAVRLTDADGTVGQTQVRLTLTFNAVTDLPEVNDVQAVAGP